MKLGKNVIPLEATTQLHNFLSSVIPT